MYQPAEILAVHLSLVSPSFVSISLLAILMSNILSIAPTVGWLCPRVEKFYPAMLTLSKQFYKQTFVINPDLFLSLFHAV